MALDMSTAECSPVDARRAPAPSPTADVDFVDGETHMEDLDIALQPRRLFKDNPPLRLSDNLAASRQVT